MRAGETWAKRVEEWRRSGLTSVQFAKKVGVSAKSLTWWKWKLGATTELAKGPAITAADATPLTFIEMAATPAMEVVLRNGIVLRLASHFDGKSLERLLDVLERR